MKNEMVNVDRTQLIEILTEELVKKLVEYMFNDIHKSLDYGKITSEVQQSIINKLTIKELRESLGSEE